MEASFLVQPWIATRTIADYCRLCYQARDGSSFLNCKRAHLGGYNTLLATLRMEPAPQFGDTLKQLEDCKETCLSTRNPDERCYEKMQHTLQHTQQLYEQILDEYKSKYATSQTGPHQLLACKKQATPTYSTESTFSLFVTKEENSI